MTTVVATASERPGRGRFMVFAAAYLLFATGAGMTDSGDNGVVKQQKAAQGTKVATRETNFVLFVVFCSAL